MKGVFNAKLRWLALGLAVLLTAAFVWTSFGRAQVQNEWTRPYRLSTQGRKATEAYLTSDQFGYVHVFWSEALNDVRSILQYARFDGETWSLPIDIRILVPYGILQTISPIVDDHGTLHLVWSEGDTGPVYYSQAPAFDALSVQDWREPLRINLDAKHVLLEVDSDGVFHMLYSKVTTKEPGVYYVRSFDEGITWSDPRWLDPDIPPNYLPSNIQFSIDENDGLHAVWYYIRLDAVGGDWIRYAHTLDGGETWSQPFTIARDVEETGSLNAASPIMIAQGENVHIVWAQGELFYRQHRYSEDSGRTWHNTERILGDLNGQAFEGLAVDGLGRVHFFGQIRYPQGIYHSIWDGEAWSTPSLVYLVSASPSDPIGNRIHAHHTHPAIRAGNQILLTFADSPPEPDRRLFAMEKTMEDVPARAPMPTPTMESVSEPDPTAIPTPVHTPTPSYINDPAFRERTSTSPGDALWFGVIPSLIIVAGIVVVWNLIRNRL